MTRDGAETWNQSKAPDGAQSSAWNQTKNSKEGTSNFREATDSWGKAAANSWGKKRDLTQKPKYPIPTFFVISNKISSLEIFSQK